MCLLFCFVWCFFIWGGGGGESSFFDVEADAKELESPRFCGGAGQGSATQSHQTPAERQGCWDLGRKPWFPSCNWGAGACHGLCNRTRPPSKRKNKNPKWPEDLATADTGSAASLNQSAEIKIRRKATVAQLSCFQ